MVSVRHLVFALALVGCGGALDATPDAPVGSATFLLTNARDLEGTPITLAVVDGSLVARDELPPSAPRMDAEGATIVPAFVDAHVHLSYDPVATEHAAGGIAVAIDLAAPIEALTSPGDPLLVLRSGPMITSPNGYPLDSWGRAGFGIECADASSCTARVDQLVTAGAAVIKVPIEDVGGLDDASLAAIGARAHALHRLFVAHALTQMAVTRALRAGVDVLAHTPVTALDETTLEAMRGHAVISTLSAFGGVETLRALRAHGVDVVYGTDLGNTRTTGIDPDEIALLAAAGLDLAAIVEAATATPARLFGLPRHGELSPGHAASFLLYRRALTDPTQLASPDVVVLDGVVRQTR